MHKLVIALITLVAGCSSVAPDAGTASPYTVGAKKVATAQTANEPPPSVAEAVTETASVTTSTVTEIATETTTSTATVSVTTTVSSITPTTTATETTTTTATTAAPSTMSVTCGGLPMGFELIEGTTVATETCSSPHFLSDQPFKIQWLDNMNFLESCGFAYGCAPGTPCTVMFDAEHLYTGTCQ